MKTQAAESSKQFLKWLTLNSPKDPCSCVDEYLPFQVQAVKPGGNVWRTE